MIKKILIGLPLAACITGNLAAQSGVVLIDFGNASAAPADAVTWNSNVTGAVSGLLDTTGTNSGISISFTGTAPSTSSLTTSWDDRTIVPTWAASATDALADRLFNSNGQTGSMVISGLNPALSYNIELASAFQAASGGAGSTPSVLNMVDANGVDADGKGVPLINVHTGAELTFDNGNGYFWTVRTGQGDWQEGWLGWLGAVPNASGELIINYNTGQGSLSRTAFNAMEITAVPEPSVFAWIAGAAALGLVGWRRRTRK
jgi:hypothetical protein